MLENSTQTTELLIVDGIFAQHHPLPMLVDKTAAKPHPELSNMLARLLQRAGIKVDKAINYLAASHINDPNGV